MKDIFKVKYFGFFILFFLLFFISGTYIYYLYKYPEPPNVEYLLKYYPEDLILKTGGYLEPPRRRIEYFLNFSPLKEKGAIRIGAFGDSFTFGTEVDKTETYPYQLQQMFNRKFPNKKIEVLNFGIPGGGMQEQFLLWEKYSGSYGLDYVLFGPRGFYSDRALTFRKNWGPKHTDLIYPWDRFVLSGNNKLKQVHIRGDTLEERYKNYYRLIPSWTALHYDKEPFQIWRIFSPFLKHIPNPFYYTKMSDEEESVKINTLLLEKIKQVYNKKILFFTDNQELFDNYSSVGSEYKLNFIEYKKNLFYKMFDHNSSLGNELMANIYLNALTGKRNFALNIISCYFKDIEYINREFGKNLYHMNSIQVIANNVPVFELVQNSSDHDHYHSERSYFNNKIKGTKNFLGLSNKTDFLKFPYFPLSVQLKEGMKIYIKSGRDRIKLGTIKPLDISGRFFVFHEDFIEGKIDINYSYYESYFLLNKMPGFLKKKLERTHKPMELFVENDKLGTLRSYDLYGQKSLRLDPVNGYEKSFLMMGPSHHVREKVFPSVFSLSLKYNMNNGETFKSLIPNWKCRKQKKQFMLTLPHFKFLKLR